MVFLDTEFNTSRAGPQLISIALVAETCEFYGEVEVGAVAGRREVRRNKFINAHVLPQLAVVTGAGSTREGIADRLVAWLNALEGDCFSIAYDFNVDYLLLEGLVSTARTPLNKRLVPCHVGYLLEERSGVAAAEESWSNTSKARGLNRHHALADALALRARFEAVHQ